MTRLPLANRRPLSALALAALTLAACSDSSSPSTSPTPETTSEIFSSTITQSGTVGYPFTVKATGPLRVSLTTVAPLSNMSLGVSIGSWTGSSCAAAAFTKNDNARAGVAALSGEVTIGNYCINVYDSGNIAADTTVTFSAEIVHP